MRTRLFTFSIQLIGAVAFSLAGCQANPNVQGQDGLEVVQPDEGTRYQPSGSKADANAPVTRIGESISGTPSPAKVYVNLSTKGINPVSVGVVYSVGYQQNGNSGWKTAYGTYQSSIDGNRYSYSVEAVLEKDWGYYVQYFRYAVFAVDGPSGKTYWDNNNGDDYFVFNNPASSVLLSNQTNLLGDSVLLDLYSINFGVEKVFVKYSFDEWASSTEKAAQWIDNGSQIVDHYQLEVPTSSGDQELVYVVRVEFDNGKVWANNFGHDYRVGLVPSDPIQVWFNADGFEVKGTLKRGGFFKTVYNRQAVCSDCYQGMCSRTIQAGYRFYDDNAFWTDSMWQSNSSTSCQSSSGWCPEIMNSNAVYIPLNAEKLSLWFHHTGGRPTCSSWDSNNGNNYDMTIE